MIAIASLIMLSGCGSASFHQHSRGTDIVGTYIPLKQETHPPMIPRVTPKRRSSKDRMAWDK